jgi:hypothetical protein
MVLVGLAVGVLGLGVYLYVEVSSTSTAVANVRPRAETKASPQKDSAEPAPTKGPEDAPHPLKSKIRAALGESRSTAPAPSIVERPGAHIDIKKDELMATANKAYDHGDFDEAIVIAKKVLSNDPANTRMLRIVISASCILGDSAIAQKSYLLLAIGGNDRADMKKRCDRYGVTFTES